MPPEERQPTLPPKLKKMFNGKPLLLIIMMFGAALGIGGKELVISFEDQSAGNAPPGSIPVSSETIGHIKEKQAEQGEKIDEIGGIQVNLQFAVRDLASEQKNQNEKLQDLKSEQRTQSAKLDDIKETLHRMNNNQ